MLLPFLNASTLSAFLLLWTLKMNLMNFYFTTRNVWKNICKNKYILEEKHRSCIKTWKRERGIYNSLPATKVKKFSNNNTAVIRKNEARWGAIQTLQGDKIAVYTLHLVRGKKKNEGACPKATASSRVEKKDVMGECSMNQAQAPKMRMSSKM